MRCLLRQDNVEVLHQYLTLWLEIELIPYQNRLDKYLEQGQGKMADILDIIENIDTIYNSNSSLAILKDFERVFDELDMYVFENWKDGELVSGPKVERHWVTCEFMWPKDKMPNPDAAKRLSEHGCGVKYKKDVLVQPRRIKTPNDIRPGTKKGKLDESPIWVVEVTMPKKLILDIFRGYHQQMMDDVTPIDEVKAPELAPPPESQAVVQQDAAAGAENVA
jgi:hypothetical protein